MSYETGCYGKVLLGKLPDETQKRLAGLPGEWLEFDPSSGAVVVRLCQPSSSPCLPTITSELERMLAEVPALQRAVIPGGDLYVHTESKGQLVRLRVERGANLQISWAQPDYSRAERLPYTGQESLVAPQMQRLNGCASLVTTAPRAALRQLEALAHDFLGLYPEGEFLISVEESRNKVLLQLRDVNLDALLLIRKLEQIAAPGSLTGRIEVSSFAAAAPEQYARFLFEEGKVWIERPALWEESRAEQQPSLVGPA